MLGDMIGSPQSLSVSAASLQSSQGDRNINWRELINFVCHARLHFDMWGHATRYMACSYHQGHDGDSVDPFHVCLLASELSG